MTRSSNRTITTFSQKKRVNNRDTNFLHGHSKVEVAVRVLCVSAVFRFGVGNGEGYRCNQGGMTKKGEFIKGVGIYVTKVQAVVIHNKSKTGENMKLRSKPGNLKMTRNINNWKIK